ncbi:hypothetical protein BGW42_005298 [Actinomortierella wolfii]|nr:hypothetical protein BGW42_005298 [Actinomortierella wolfii]
MNPLPVSPARMSLAAIAVATARRPSVVAVMSQARRYTTTRQFSDKEKAEEDQYARQRDAERIKKLQAQMSQTEKELAEAKKKVAELEDKLKGKRK